MGTVAAELRDQEMFLRDPATRWVRHVPRHAGECCLVARQITETSATAMDCSVIELSEDAVHVLRELIVAEKETWWYISPPAWNDAEPGVTRERVILLLEEAADWTEEAGL